MRRASGSDMQLTVTGKQLGVGEALRSHVEASLEALLIKYFGSAIEAHAVFAREAHLIRADLSVHIGRGIMVKSAATRPITIQPLMPQPSGWQNNCAATSAGCGTITHAFAISRRSLRPHGRLSLRRPKRSRIRSRSSTGRRQPPPSSLR